MAAALSLTLGRGGALFGGLVFGFLIDLNCVIPIVLFASLLFCKYTEESSVINVKAPKNLLTYIKAKTCLTVTLR